MVTYHKKKTWKVVDLHCDTISSQAAKRAEGRSAQLFCADGHVDLCRMRKGGYSLQVFALFVDRAQHADAYRFAKSLLNEFFREMERNQQWISQVRTYDEWKNNERQGKLSALLSIEEGGVCEGNTAYLQEFYNAGVRMMTLTWNYANELGLPNGAFPDGPLTKLGHEFLEQMEEMGMLIDVSHLSDQGFYDVLRRTRKPLLASHSNARALCPHPRNLSDDMIGKIAERGGLIGVNFYPPFVEPDSRVMRLPALAAHIRHIISVGGCGCVALGTDFDGMSGELAIADASMMQRLPEYLTCEFSEAEIDRLMWENAERFFKENL